jgi:hypothetical protein
MDIFPYPSGEWVGYYTYLDKPTKLPMHMTLEFSRGSIRGAGIDKPGRFVVDGSFDESTLEAKWSKRYVGKHSVEYVGELRDGEISGSWSLAQVIHVHETRASGQFRIWPLPADLYGDDESLQSILEREIRRKG